MMSSWQKYHGFILYNSTSSFHIWIQIEAIMCKTWILKIIENGFDFRPLTIFQTQTETEIWIY